MRDADSLASWLYGVALRVAVRAKADAARRRLYERRSAEMKAAGPEREVGRPESWPELHEEIARLPQHFREPVVLCYLEGLTTEEAALRIGCPRGTVLSRLSRARDRLRERLNRRGLTPPVASVTALPLSQAKAVLPPMLLGETVRASLRFAGRQPIEAGLAATTASMLARGVLYAMTISKLKIFGTTALACAFALGGLQTFGRFGGFVGSQKPTRAVTGADERLVPLTRSVDKLQSELDETARSTTKMRKALQEIRAEIKAMSVASSRPAAGNEAINQVAEVLRSKPAEAVARLAEALKRHPAPRRGADGDRLQLYMMDLVKGGTTLIADEPDPGLDSCNVPKWSHDGTRIVFRASTWTRPQASRIKAIEVRDGRPTLTDLGLGNCPTFSPNDKRIAFMLDHGAEPGAEAGVWVMQADGSDRRRVGEYGAPLWSPDGREFLINQDSKPTVSIVINLETKEGGILEVAGHQIFSWPSWAGPGTLVSSIGTEREGDSIALLDVRKPAQAKIIEVLWKRGDSLDVAPLWPVYQPDTRRCVFVGAEATKRTLYSVQRGESPRARRLEPEGYNDRLSGLSFSPDGRYLLFCGNRPQPR